MSLGTAYKLCGYFAVGAATAIIIKNFVLYGVFFCIVAVAIFSAILAMDKEQGITTKKAVLVTAIATSVFGIIV